MGEEAMYSLPPAYVSGIPGCQMSASYLHRHTAVSPEGLFQGRSQAGTSSEDRRGAQAGLLGTVTGNAFEAVEDDSFYDWRARA